MNGCSYIHKLHTIKKLKLLRKKPPLRYVSKIHFLTSLVVGEANYLDPFDPSHQKHLVGNECRSFSPGPFFLLPKKQGSKQAGKNE